MTDYYLIDGTEVSAAQIKAAFLAGNAVLVHSHCDGATATGLALDGQDIDTRDECHSMWDECWTRSPRTIGEALRAAQG